MAKLTDLGRHPMNFRTRKPQGLWHSYQRGSRPSELNLLEFLTIHPEFFGVEWDTLPGDLYPIFSIYHSIGLLVLISTSQENEPCFEPFMKLDSKLDLQWGGGYILLGDDLQS